MRAGGYPHFDAAIFRRLAGPLRLGPVTKSAHGRPQPDVHLHDALPPDVPPHDPLPPDVLAPDVPPPDLRPQGDHPQGDHPQRAQLQGLLDTQWPPFQLATRTELINAGLGERAISTTVAWGILVRVRRGVYIRRQVWQPLSETEQNLHRIEAHWLGAAVDGVYTHATAARLHRCFVWGVPPAVHITLPFATSRSSYAEDTVTHHQQLPAEDIVRLKNPRGGQYLVTTLERTVVDCARTLDLQRAVIIGDAALRQGADLALMLRMVEATPGSRGVRKARAVLAALDARSESPGESRTRLLLRSFGLQLPIPQFELITRAGLYRADFAWPELKLILEFDGRIKYFEYGSTDEAVFQERRREKALMELGWTFLRVEWADLARPAELRARLTAAMDRARRLAAA